MMIAEEVLPGLALASEATRYYAIVWERIEAKCFFLPELVHLRGHPHLWIKR
jgi:hypothetical protein